MELDDKIQELKALLFDIRLQGEHLQNQYNAKMQELNKLLVQKEDLEKENSEE